MIRAPITLADLVFELHRKRDEVRRHGAVLVLTRDEVATLALEADAPHAFHMLPDHERTLLGFHIRIAETAQPERVQVDSPPEW